MAGTWKRRTTIGWVVPSTPHTCATMCLGVLGWPACDIPYTFAPPPLPSPQGQAGSDKGAKGGCTRFASSVWLSSPPRPPFAANLEVNQRHSIFPSFPIPLLFSGYPYTLSSVGVCHCHLKKPS